MREGPETEEGNEGTEQTSKVVRLPRDWLGPREHLVSFGPPAPPEPEPEAPPPTPGVPSTADAFWGEDSAAIHDAVEAPAGGRAASEAPRSVPPPTWFGPVSRRALVAAVGLAAAAAVAVFALLAPGSQPGVASHGARLDIAAILSDGVARISKVQLPRIAPTHRTPRLRVVHHTAHRPPRITTDERHNSSPAPTYAVRATVASATPVVHTSALAPTPYTSAPPTESTSTHSAAPVTPTGQSGALGPISSPNG